jgi:hypothetical protein
MPDASAPPWAQSEKDREKRRLKVRTVPVTAKIGAILALFFVLEILPFYRFHFRHPRLRDRTPSPPSPPTLAPLYRTSTTAVVLTPPTTSDELWR